MQQSINRTNQQLANPHAYIQKDFGTNYKKYNNKFSSKPTKRKKLNILQRAERGNGLYL